MSPRPMRNYKAAPLVCLTCGKSVRLVYRDGQWHHVERLRITDPAWHLPRVA